MTATINTHRNATLATLAEALESMRTHAVDVVAPASKIRASGGALVVEGIEPLTELSDTGVTTTDPNGVYRCTRVADEGVSAKLNVPIRFLSHTRNVAWCPGSDGWPENYGGTTLWDHTVNALLQDSPDARYLLRLLRNRDGDHTAGYDGYDGVLRAFLSNSYRCIDNLDVLLAALSGLGEAGMADGVDVHGDLTERRMVVRVRSTQIAALAPELLKGYRSPFDGSPSGAGWTPERVANASRGEGMSYKPGEEPIVFAGFLLTNSEVGGGALDLRPELTIRVCKNGLTINGSAIRRVHLGGKLDDGAIRWSDATIKANLELVKRQVADAVAQWMTPEFLVETVDALERDAGTPIEDAPAVIQAVSKKLGFTEAEASGILGMFTRGGQMTAGGVMQAVTAQAQATEDGDRALELEYAGVDAMRAAVAAVKS